MSATNRSDVRHPDDFYVTPAWVVESLLKVIQIDPTDFVLDAGSGTGSITRALLESGKVDKYHSICVEMDAERAAASGFTVNVQPYETWDTYVDLVVMNPPYKDAMAFVKKSMEVAPKVAALLRLSWLGSQGRANFHREHPSDIWVLPKRPSFTPDGKTDAAEYAWFLFGFTQGGNWGILP